MPVLRDPNGSTIMNTYGVSANRDADFVLDAGMRIVRKIEGGGSGQNGTISEETVRPYIDALLAAD
jgi:hypothetical protein